jgi:hypothetical protein
MKRKQKGLVGLDILALLAVFVVLSQDVTVKPLPAAPGGPVCHNYNNIGCK